jgi:hypothetical protein
MMKVYVLEYGSYSDRFVEGVFSTEDGAVAHWKKAAGAYEPSITVFDLDSETYSGLYLRQSGE